MNGRSVTDAQISQALRAHLPERAQPGMRARVLDATRTTSQQRPLPLFLGALSDADPVGRRRNLLIAAALLVAMAVASATAVGAWRLIQQDPVDKLSLEPPADVPAFVLSSYERLPQLPPVALTWRGSDSTKGRVYVDRSGAVRFDRFTSADAAVPSSYTILRGKRISGVATVGSDRVWVEPGHEAIGEDPRVFLRTVLSADEGPGCEMERDSSEVGNGTAAASWRYVGLEYVAGRPTHHVACVGEYSLDTDLWLDIETRLILRTREPLADEAGQPIAGRFKTTEVTEIAFGEQPAAVFEPPEGVTRMSADAYDTYLCTAGELPNEQVVGLGTREGCPTEAEATPPPEPSPTPMPTERPNTSDCAVAASDPSEPTGPLAWTQASLTQDWPAPVRLEPAGGGGVQPIPLTYLDPMGDTGSDLFPCVDIRWVTAETSQVHLKLDSSQLVVDPADAWIAYGVVTDDDRDGVPDWRYGIDNMPVDAADHGPPIRGWRTNLHTGQTDAGPEHAEMVWSAYGEGTPLGRGPKSEYPTIGSDAGFLFGGVTETTTGSSGWGFELNMPFYTWASVIVDGRVVATDYAPDAGWLVATRGSRPGSTYLLGDPFPNLSMTVPEGWTMSSTSQSTRFGRDGELRRVACGDLPRDYPPDTAYDADCALVRFELIDNPEDNCEDMIEPNHVSFDDVVTDVAGVPGTEIADVTVDGYRGKYFEYSPREDDDVYCRFFDYEDVWIFDVDGVVLVIGSGGGGALDPDVPRKAVKAEIRQMVESIRFER